MVKFTVEIVEISQKFSEHMKIKIAQICEKIIDRKDANVFILYIPHFRLLLSLNGLIVHRSMLEKD